MITERRLPEPVRQALEDLGLPSDYGTEPALPIFEEASELVDAGTDVFDRPLRLAPDAAAAFAEMRQAAQRDGVEIQPVSGFRSIARQTEVLRGKLDAGRSLEDVLRVNVAPGFSEHHTGRALDLTTPGCRPLEEAFEDTEAFRWLTEHAGRFGFRLSYPRDNPSGISYEPWHWCYVDERWEDAG